MLGVWGNTRAPSEQGLDLSNGNPVLLAFHPVAAVPIKPAHAKLGHNVILYNCIYTVKSYIGAYLTTHRQGSRVTAEETCTIVRAESTQVLRMLKTQEPFGLVIRFVQATGGAPQAD